MERALKTIALPKPFCGDGHPLAEPLVRQLMVGREPVLVSSMPDQGRARDRQARSADNLCMARTLWRRFLCDRGMSCAERDDRTLTVIKDSLGKPELSSGAKRASVSFSHAASSTWAALAAPDCSIGIDVAEPAEFSGAYPFHRVFAGTERRIVSATSPAAEDVPAAFLWSVKEAVAKAIGCGFHLIEPLDVRVVTSGSSTGDLAPVQTMLSGKALERFPLLAQSTIDVVSWRHGNAWISIAIIAEGAAVSSGME